MQLEGEGEGGLARLVLFGTRAIYINQCGWFLVLHNPNKQGIWQRVVGRTEVSGPPKERTTEIVLSAALLSLGCVESSHPSSRISARQVRNMSIPLR